MTDIGTKKRKLDHIKIALTKNVQFEKKKTGFDDVSFEDVELVYSALPEIDLDEVDVETQFLGHKFTAPLIVSGMVGGVKEAEKINRDIAKACEAVGLGMGVGSQRAMIEDKKVARTYKVRDLAPNMFLAGNIGVAQAKEYSLEKLKWAVNEIGGNALAIHINAAQEAVQPEGDTNFREGLKTIDEVAGKLGKPVYVKEVGNGICMETAEMLAKTGIKALDVGGSGGTSWTKIEYMRRREKGEMVYAEFGIPTAAAIIEARSVFGRQIVATGGIRNGLHVLKALVLGADFAGMAWPCLKAQSKGGWKGVKELLEATVKDLKRGMFLVGAKNLRELKQKKFVLSGVTKEWIEQREIETRKA